jgi:hypothetical protein
MLNGKNVGSPPLGDYFFAEDAGALATGLATVVAGFLAAVGAGLAVATGFFATDVTGLAAVVAGFLAVAGADFAGVAGFLAAGVTGFLATVRLFLMSWVCSSGGGSGGGSIRPFGTGGKSRPLLSARLTFAASTGSAESDTCAKAQGPAKQMANPNIYLPIIRPPAKKPNKSATCWF